MIACLDLLSLVVHGVVLGLLLPLLRDQRPPLTVREGDQR